MKKNAIFFFSALVNTVYTLLLEILVLYSCESVLRNVKEIIFFENEHNNLDRNKNFRRNCILLVVFYMDADP
jgi:hypothetical protein